jgi:hypothetical protein
VARLAQATGTDLQGEQDFRIVVPPDVLKTCVMLAIADSSDPGWEHAKQRTALRYNSSCHRPNSSLLLGDHIVWAMQAATKACADAGVEVGPANGSRVAELQAAKALLAEVVPSGRDGPVDGTEQVGNEALLELCLRLSRAYGMLREWERLSTTSKKGLAQRSASTTSNASAGVDVSWWFETYAQSEPAPNRRCTASTR